MQYKISEQTAKRLEAYLKHRRKTNSDKRDWYRKAGNVPYWAMSFDEVMDILLAEVGY